MTERRHYRFYGRVQGVGFRYRAQYAASMLGLTGWVCNLYDGSVELEAQGDPQALDKLVDAIAATSHWIMIEHYTCDKAPVDPDERRFRVRDSW